jgi:hypothetical protein
LEVSVRLGLRLSGRVRLARGRCPGCASDPRVSSCTICHGYEGPFPPSEASLSRWAARFDAVSQAPDPALRTARVGSLAATPRIG